MLPGVRDQQRNVVQSCVKRKEKEDMTVKELIEWIHENNMEDAEVYVNGEHGYEKVTRAWESEAGGGAVMLETKLDVD